jgi:hypothetical protein
MGVNGSSMNIVIAYIRISGYMDIRFFVEADAK